MIAKILKIVKKKVKRFISYDWNGVGAKNLVNNYYSLERGSKLGLEIMQQKHSTAGVSVRCGLRIHNNTKKRGGGFKIHSNLNRLCSNDHRIFTTLKTAMEGGYDEVEEIFADSTQKVAANSFRRTRISFTVKTA